MAIKVKVSLDKVAIDGLKQAVKVIGSRELIDSTLAKDIKRVSEETIKKYFPKGKQYRDPATGQFRPRMKLQEGWYATVSYPMKGAVQIYLRHRQANNSRVATILGALEYGSRARIIRGQPFIAFVGTVGGFNKAMGKRAGKNGKRNLTIVRRYVEVPSQEGIGYLQKTYDEISRVLQQNKIKYINAIRDTWKTGKKGYRV